MTGKHDAIGLAARVDETGQLLVRSGIEIGHTLETMQAAGDALCAELESEEHLFVSRLLAVDARNGTMTLAWSDSKEANALIVERRSIAFSANHAGLHFQFNAGNPRETTCGGRSAIQFSFGGAMLAVQRRAASRRNVPAAAPLRCEISVGALSFEAQVVDVSTGGIGAFIFDPSIRLEAGMILPRARITVPGHPPVLAALEVRYVRTVVLADGPVVKRAGCRFIAPGAAIEALVRVYLTAVTPRKAAQASTRMA